MYVKHLEVTYRRKEGMYRDMWTYHFVPEGEQWHVSRSFKAFRQYLLSFPQRESDWKGARIGKKLYERFCDYDAGLEE